MTGVYELKEWDRLINTYGPFPILLCDKKNRRTDAVLPDEYNGN
jgi:hypothetical protein